MENMGLQSAASDLGTWAWGVGRNRIRFEFRFQPLTSCVTELVAQLSGVCIFVYICMYLLNRVLVTHHL